MFYAPGLVAHSGIEIVTRAFYALHDTRTPVYIGVAAMLANLLLSLSLIGPMQIAGLALANSMAAFVEMVLLLWFIRPRVGGLGGARTWVALGKAGLAAAAMAAAVWAFLAFAPAGCRRRDLARRDRRRHRRRECMRWRRFSSARTRCAW